MACGPGVEARSGGFTRHESLGVAGDGVVFRVAADDWSGAAPLRGSAEIAARLQMHYALRGALDAVQSPHKNAPVLAAGGTKFADAVNAVSSKLTLAAMQAMNKAVGVDKKTPKAVAAAFLKANGLT